MNEHRTIIQAQTDTLLKLIESAREEQTGTLRAETEDAVLEVLRLARRTARENVSKSVREERARAADALRQLEAAAETRRNTAQRRRDAALLEMAWPRLEAALESRWSRPENRREWMAAAFATAAGVLPDGTWQVRHPADVTEDAISRASAEALADRVISLSFVADPELTAGVVVEIAAVSLDATPAGLLARRRDVESDLLGELMHDGEHGKHGMAEAGNALREAST
jgi:hypothetical protein